MLLKSGEIHSGSEPLPCPWQTYCSMKDSSSSCSVAPSGISHLPGVHPDNQEGSAIDGKAEAPERLRHSLKVTQYEEAEMGSAFLTDIS